MATLVDWNKLGGRAAAAKAAKGAASGKPVWLRIDKEVTVRPIGQAVEFVKIFVKTPQGARSVIVDPEDADKAVALLSAEAGYDVKANNRFAMNVIDRADGTIKILEGGMQVFGYWAKWQNASGIHPGSREGYDWKIEAEKTGPGPENKKYTPIQGKQTPISAQEWEMINKRKTEYTLSEVYKSVPLDQVVDRVFNARTGNGGGDGAGGGGHAPEVEEPATQGTPSNSPIEW